ncbi:MAG: FAD-binding oxidoreductase, partial [Rhodospirillaceae bacterium]|nr:FAD-binding oxidoreductase [Rhodospirillaceae bacterium]
MAIPPGITEQDFASALQEFANIVGEEWVFTSEEDTSLYKDVYSIYQNSDLEPEVSAAIAPDSAEQVQAIVRVA